MAGASGLIGSELVRRLTGDGHTILRLVRHAPKGPGEVRWDPARGEVDAAALDGVDAVVNLAGENVGERWTGERRKRIRQSRVDATLGLARTLAGLARKPRVLVNASAIGIYGERGDERVDEMSAPGSGFLAEVVREWEAATEPASAAGIRVVLPRFAVVLSKRGGMLAKVLTPFRLGAGGTMGSGRQWLSWVSLGDAVDVLYLSLVDDRLDGPINVVAGAVTNDEFTRTLARVLSRPALVPVPAFALRLAFGEMANETILVSQRADHRRLTQLGYSFAEPELEGALRAALAEKD
ncbi:TIGR01777 family oxidoreductase [Longimicrobium sp.]|uniref:TIGR01777 family oxidoreductase n=1 Tax=Longimicrobium sp. TaxID=2029185 RepID=UPI002D7E5D92|nr:TIGR01777 family oxidoreductase [Longimicrobium sp.]